MALVIISINVNVSMQSENIDHSVSMEQTMIYYCKFKRSILARIREIC